ncbi:MAG: sulfotransferase [Schleiferiaceae bacterium]|nr:sulfotransferase [Schleiferiaceae bacterium]
MATFDFLVIGAGRSGTSLLAAFLDAHPQLRCGMEFQSVATLSHSAGNWLKKDTAARRLQRFVAACNREANKQPEKSWGNKITTEQLAFLKPVVQSHYYKEVEGAFAGLKIIFVHRDGRTCIPSKIQRGGKTLPEAISYWKDAVALGQWLLKNRPKQLMVVQYENLVQHPEETLQDICAFLAIPYHPSMLEGVKSAVLPEMYQFGTLKRDLRTITKEDWHHTIAEELALLGYTQ